MYSIFRNNVLLIFNKKCFISNVFLILVNCVNSYGNKRLWSENETNISTDYTNVTLFIETSAP